VPRLIDPRHLVPGAAAFAAATLVALLGLRAGAADRPPAEEKQPATGRVSIQLLGVNDWHGHLEAPRPGLGGAAYLGAHLDRAAAAAPNRTIRVHAGDMWGATPFASSHFHDEPAVEAMNLMGFDVGTLGNHEFDEGGDEVLRLLRGGQRRDRLGRPLPTSDPRFAGVRFPYVAANTIDRRTGRRVLPPYRIVERAGARVGFIGVTTETTPHYVLPRHSSRFRWLDISDTVNRQVAALRARGVEAIVVLAHSGARGNPGPTGEIVDEAREMSDAVDVIVAGHTQNRLNVRVDGKLLVQAFAYGTAFDRIRLTIDRASGHVTASAAATPFTRHAGVDAHAGLDALTRKYVGRVERQAGRVLGRATRPMRREAPVLGNVIADAQRAYARADVALVNPGNMRGSLDAGPITYAELFKVQAYEHPLIRMTLRGADLRAAIGQQRRDGGEVELFTSGVPARIDPDRRYSVVVNELLAEGERFDVLRDRGRGRRVVGTDLQALAAWVRRVRRVP
jgi:5'-nucleotidase